MCKFESNAHEYGEENNLRGNQSLVFEINEKSGEDIESAVYNFKLSPSFIGKPMVQSSQHEHALEKMF